MIIDPALTYLITGLVAVLAALLGALLFGGAAVAPLAVRVLDEAAAARLLRAYWPRYYRLAIAVGAALTAVLLLLAADALPGGSAHRLLPALGGLMTVSFFVALMLIPRINAARDRGDDRSFRRLHGVDMGLTALGLLAGFALLALLVAVVPAQIVPLPVGWTA